METEESEAAMVKTETEEGPELVPLFRAATADLNTTLALAIFSIVLTQIFGFQHLKLGYLKKFFNFSNPLMTFVGILELVSEFAKIVSFAFRLFGNVFAGEVLLAVMAFLVPVVVPMPFYGLELFVGFIQALVFAMLSLVFFNMATQSHDEH
jgi:F-type H+-transporting ATPase subunit a